MLIYTKYLEIFGFNILDSWTVICQIIIDLPILEILIPIFRNTS